MITAAVGYTSSPVVDGPDALQQREAIEQACRRLALDLADVVHDEVPAGRTTAARPGLHALLDRIDSGEVRCLIVSKLEQLAGNVDELGEVLARMEGDDRRLIALDMELDTSTLAGKLAVAPRRKVRTEAERGGSVEAEAPPVLPVLPADDAAPWANEEAPPKPRADDRPALRRQKAPPPTGAENRTARRGAKASSDRALRTLGYASVAADEDSVAQEFGAQAQAIEAACERLGLSLVEIIRERATKSGKALDRAGVSYLVERLAAGEASCVVVTGLNRLSHSVAELGKLVEWFGRCDVRLVAVDLGLDTANPDGQTAARALTSVAGWEQERLSERTRKGLAAARAKRGERGDASTPDWAAVRGRIALMRADGMTLQAIADILNEEGVPTPRGGAIWRPSSVQTAAGYKRRRRQASVVDLPAPPPRK